jgi:CRISPR-associated protein Csx17
LTIEMTMPMTDIVLQGCAPVPLAAYLKALGIFRLVAEQKDKDVAGFWREEAFILHTALTQEQLVRFFLDDYSPSPIISPWNGRAGFLEGEDTEDSTRSGAELLRQFQQTTATRFHALRFVLSKLTKIPFINALNSIRSERKKEEVRQKRLKQDIRNISDEDKEKLNALRKREKAAKDTLVSELRSCVPDELVDWMDACLRLGVLTGAAPLLGSGGNDGSRELGVNYGQKIAEIFDLVDPLGAAKATAVPGLEAALFGTPTIGLYRDAMGQFAPAQTGPNNGVGFGAESPLNPWDSVLTLEGAIMFAGSTTRRLGASDQGTASFPFTVTTTGAAGAGSVTQDERESRGELWMPLWSCSASFAEIRTLMSEGRATLGRQPIRDGLDFGRAVSALGVSRGVTSFQRYGLMKREGRNYIAAPMSRLRVGRNPNTDLLHDLDRGLWLPQFRAHARSKGASARLRSIGREFDEAIFAMAQESTPESVQRVLIAVSDAAAYLASSPKARDPKQGNQKPPPRLSHRWFHAADDGTVEFRIAAALAGLGRTPRIEGKAEDEQESTAGDEDATEEVSEIEGHAANQVTAIAGEEPAIEIPQPPFRAHLAPLDEKSWYARRRGWSDQHRLAAWGGGMLERYLIVVLERRLLFATQRNLAGSPFDGRAPADLASVLAFLAREVDDAKIADLAQGLAWAEPPNFIGTKPAEPRPLLFAYAVMKPFFAPVEALRELGAPRNRATLLIPPGLVGRLQRGDIGAAVRLASRRARASGLPLTFEPAAEHMAGTDGPRLLAALLIPIRTVDLRVVVERAYPALFDIAETGDNGGTC